MRIYYRGQGSRNLIPAVLPNEPNLLALTGNNWDDYGTKTTLDACLYFEGQRFDFNFHIKLLIEGQDYTALALDRLRNTGWDGFFPIPATNYLSLPSDIDFYNTIISKLGPERALRAIIAIRDASYFIHLDEDPVARLLTESEAFSSSLLRESGATKAYQDGWRIFNGSQSEIIDFDLNLYTKEKTSRAVPFKFQSPILPYDINILIGPNGVGKSYSLKSLVEYWLKTGIGEPNFLEALGHKPFSVTPNFGKLILVSYSPFEEFTLDLNEVKLQDKEAYKYFGFRFQNEQGDIGISRNLPSFNSAESIIKAIYDDEKFDFIGERVKKFSTVKDALKNAFSFDAMALEVEDESQVGTYFLSLIHINGKHYLPLKPEIAKNLPEEQLRNACKLSTGVVFLKNELLCSLSSGQRLFTYIVINVVGELRENSLVVIDEPELFLHPTLEIEFISLLKKILKPFKSKAILATHSLSVVREVPSRCVHIFRDEEHGLDIIPPPFETFGGDMQRISSYVFGDKSVTKPFEDLLIEQVNIHLPERLIELLGDEINEEMMMKILRLGRKNGR